MIKKAEKLRFSLNDDVIENFIELTLTKQILNECKLSDSDRKLLEHHRKVLSKKFTLVFRNENEKQLRECKNRLSKK